MASYDNWKLDNGERYPDRSPCGGYVTKEAWDEMRNEAHGQISKALDAYEPEIDLDGDMIEVTIKLRLTDLAPECVDRERFSEAGYLPPDDRDLRRDVAELLEAAAFKVRRDMEQRP